MLPDLLKAENTANQPTAIHKVTNLNTLCQVMNDVNSSKVMFKEDFTLLKNFLTIPVTTANAERTFSALRCLKTYLRSTMSQPRLNHVMLLHIHKEGQTHQILYKLLGTLFLLMTKRSSFWTILILTTVQNFICMWLCNVYCIKYILCNSICTYNVSFLVPPYFLDLYIGEIVSYYTRTCTCMLCAHAEHAHVVSILEHTHCKLIY